jgi:hypothetical protein
VGAKNAKALKCIIVAGEGIPPRCAPPDLNLPRALLLRAPACSVLLLAPCSRAQTTYYPMLLSPAVPSSYLALKRVAELFLFVYILLEVLGYLGDA